MITLGSLTIAGSPFDRISVVHGELVVEVVVALSDGAERGNEVVSRCVLVVERSITEPMSEGIYAEGRVVNKEQPRRSCIEESTSPVAPSESSYGSGEDQSHPDDQGKVPPVLPSHDWVG